MKKWLNIASWILLPIGLISLLAFTDNARRAMLCDSFSVSIDYGRETSDYMLTAEEVRGAVFAACESPIGKPIENIDIELYELTIKALPYVAEADVFMGIDGKMTAKITQSHLILRVIEENDSSYYLDEEGRVLPLSQLHSAHVLLAGGFVRDSLYTGTPLSQASPLEKHSRLYKIYTLASYIGKDEFMKAFISQIYMDEKAEIYLVPRIGRHLILFGNLDQMEEKFEKLMHFYQQGLSKTGWDAYSLVNVKYSNQVICTKK